MAAAGFVGGSVTVPDRLLSLKAGASWPELIRRARPGGCQCGGLSLSDDVFCGDSRSSTWEHVTPFD